MSDSAKVLKSYVTDMIALEEHIGRAIKAQAEDFEDEHPEITAYLRRAEALTQAHVTALESVAKAEKGGVIGEVVKRAGTMVASLGAAAVDLVRTEKLPKNLRDDYTAGSLAYIGYVMLLTTARALGDQRVANLAQEHMADWAQLNLVLGELIPESVLTFLRDEKLPVGAVNPSEINESARRVWATAE